MSTDKLPDGWTRVKFGDVVHNVNENSRDLAADGLDRVVGLDHLDPGSLRLMRWDNLADLPDGTTFTRKFKPGQVLFGKRRAYQRKVAVSDFAGVCSGDILVFEPADKRMLAEFLPYLVQSDGFFDHALGTSAGSLSPRTKWAELAKYEFGLPPIEEQQRISEILEAADSVASALEGALTSCRVLATAEISRVLAEESHPRGCVADIVVRDTQGVQVGPFGGSLASRHFRVAGTPVLKIQNLSPDGEIDSSNLVYVASDYADSLSRYKVAVGDVVTAAQATIGRSALVGTEAAGALISQHLIRVRPNPELFLPSLLCWLFNSDHILRQMARVKTKTTRDGLNTADVQAFEIPLVPLTDQLSLACRLDQVRSLERSLSVHRNATSECRRGLLTALLRGGD